MITRAILALLLAGCADKDPQDSGGGACPAGPCDSGSADSSTDSGDTDSTADSGESGESGETGDTAETGDSGSEWDPNKPLELCINEFMPSNDNALLDESSGLYVDWIELHNPGEEDLSLDGWSLTDDRDEPTKSTLSGGLTLGAGEFLVLFADDAADLGATHLDFKLAQDGGTLGVYAPDGRGSLITYGYIETDISAARVTDCCSGSDCWEYVYKGTPGLTNYAPDPVEIDLVDAGSAWAWWDQGYEPSGDWTALDFDDAAWPTGSAPLGYGDSHIVTTISYGSDGSNKYTTSYFRLVFPVEDASAYTDALGTLLKDDGAIVYLNGEEVERSNMPDGAVTYSTFASGSTSDETGYAAFTVDPALLVEGDNVLAVEVHQASLDSSDLGFDLTLSAEYLPTE